MGASHRKTNVHPAAGARARANDRGASRKVWDWPGRADLNRRHPAPKDVSGLSRKRPKIKANPTISTSSPEFQVSFFITIYHKTSQILGNVWATPLETKISPCTRRLRGFESVNGIASVCRRCHLAIQQVHRLEKRNNAFAGLPWASLPERSGLYAVWPTCNKGIPKLLSCRHTRVVFPLLSHSQA